MSLVERLGRRQAALLGLVYLRRHGRADLLLLRLQLIRTGPARLDQAALDLQQQAGGHEGQRKAEGGESVE